MRWISLAVAVAIAPSAVRAQPQWQNVPDEAVERALDHFPESNEHRHDLFFAEVAGRGGAYLGVGSDQSYSIAAAQGADTIVLVDYDPVVTRIHRALTALMARCEEAACLMRALEPAQEEASARAIRAALGGGWEAERTHRTFLEHRPLLRRNLARQRERDTWIGRPDWYARLHHLAREGRIVARIADLRGPRAMPQIAREARRGGLVFSVIYLSNAEEYLEYEGGFADNLAALPSHPSTIVLRTLRDRRLSRAPGDRAWHYDVQPLADLMRRIREEHYADSSYLVRDLIDAARDERPGLSRLDENVRAQGERGPARWWLDVITRPAAREDERGSRSRLLTSFARAVRPALDPSRAARLDAIDLDGTGVAHLGPSPLPIDRRTNARFVLSGEPVDEAIARADVPEESLLALLLDAIAREVLPPLFAREGRVEQARSLERAPAVADLYAAYRLRERLLEICPPRGSGSDEGAMRACRAATRIVIPAPTRRTRPTWIESEGRVRTALRTIARENERVDPGSTRLIDALSRLAEVARSMDSAGR
jgi:hypothetical protein